MPDLKSLSIPVRLDASAITGFLRTLKRTELVWYPERGMGFYPVTEQPYDADYFAKYQRYAETERGRALTEARAQLVMRHTLWTRAYWLSMCDVGIGCGAFVSRFDDRVTGYDINPAAVEWLEARSLFSDPRQATPDVLTFWDSLEHIIDASAFVGAARRWVFCSLPIFDGPDHVLRSKHFRRDEHCWYWTRDGLIGWMAELGFECAEHNTMETLLGREDIHSFAFRRREPELGGVA